MNTVHRLLDFLLPFNYDDPDIVRITLRAIPFTIVAIYLALLWLNIVTNIPRSGSDALVASQAIVKSGLVMYIGLLALNYWEVYTAPSAIYDLARIYLGIGGTIGLPPAVYYLYKALRDWRQEWKER